MEKKLDDNYTRMLWAILNKSWRQHPTKQQLYGPLHMDEQRQDNQLEPTYSSSVLIWDVALKTCQKQWTIRKSGKRGSGISVMMSCYHAGPEWTWEQWQWKGALHSPKPQHHWNFTIRLFSVISRTLIEGVLPLCRGAVSIFYSPSRLGNHLVGFLLLNL